MKRAIMRLRRLESLISPYEKLEVFLETLSWAQEFYDFWPVSRSNLDPFAWVCCEGGEKDVEDNCCDLFTFNNCEIKKMENNDNSIWKYFRFSSIQNFNYFAV